MRDRWRMTAVKAGERETRTGDAKALRLPGQITDSESGETIESKIDSTSGETVESKIRDSESGDISRGGAERLGIKDVGEQTKAGESETARMARPSTAGEATGSGVAKVTWARPMTMTPGDAVLVATKARTTMTSGDSMLAATMAELARAMNAKVTSGLGGAKTGDSRTMTTPLGNGGPVISTGDDRTTTTHDTRTASGKPPGDGTTTAVDMATRHLASSRPRLRPRR